MNKFNKHKLATAIGIICLTSNFSAFADTLLSDPSSYENIAGNDHWTAFDILDERLDVMRLPISANLTLGQGDDKADYSHVETWLSLPENSEWQWATPEQFDAIRNVFNLPALQDNIDAFLGFNGDRWSMNKNGKWTVATKDTSNADQEANLAMLKYVVDGGSFATVSPKTGLTLKTNHVAALLVRVVAVDSDLDGVNDSEDAFPDDPAASIDDDNDGLPDYWNDGKDQSHSTSEPKLVLDLHLDDPTNGQTDTDGDNVSDEDDAFPADISASIDSDNDGYPDSWNDGKSAVDSTSEPVLVIDAFPNDAAAYLDTDGDGYPDDWNEGMSADDSNSGLLKDAFPLDAAASLDTDGDGYPDSWNDGKSADDSTTELAIDAFPEDATESIDSDGDGVGDNSDPAPQDKYDGVIQAGSRLSKSDSYENIEDNDYWTAYEILGERLDIMRFHVSASLNLKEGDNVGTAKDSDVDTWLLANPEWQWATPEQFGSLHGFFDAFADKEQDNIAAFLALNGNQWSTWTNSSNDSKWTVATKDTNSADETAGAPMLKYAVVKDDRFDDFEAVSDFKLYKDHAAALLVRVVVDPNADTDGDGVIDTQDAFINDAAASVDTDGDGYPDDWNEGKSAVDSTSAPVLALDAFPTDPTETTDTDGDGVGNNSDAFPTDPTETLDSDSDGVGDNADDFPHNASKSVDTAPVVTAPVDITVAALDSTGTSKTNATIAAFLTAASASDIDDGSITVSHDAPDTFALGDTLVTFTATDTGNNTVTAQATITITDQTAPVITLIGESTQTVALNGTYMDEGATALDNVDGDVTGDIEIDESGVDITTEGTYTVTYTVSDKKGLVGTASRTVTVQDAAAPVVIAPESITVEATSPAGTENSDASIVAFLLAATAEDAVDGTLIPSAVDVPEFFALGDTPVTFESTDSESYTGTSEATITVVDTTVPVITLNGESAITLAPNSEYTEPGATATDIVDANVTVVIGGDTVDTSVQATYTLTYTAVDNEGNHAEPVTRVVTVQDASAPVLTAPANITVAATDSDGTAISDSAISAFLAAATANDAVDGNVSITDDAPNVFPIGVTTVTFSATDSAENTGSTQATVTIADQSVPVITLIDAAVELQVGDSYLEPGFTAMDNVDGDVTANVMVSDTLDTTTAGTYQLTYNVTDTASNAAIQVTRQVVVLAADVVLTGSKLSNTDSYKNSAEQDYWTAYDILGERLDVMRLPVSASLTLTAEDEVGIADFSHVEAWLADNPEWQWSTPEQFTAIHGFFDADESPENITAFLTLNGEQWSTWVKEGKDSKWTVATKDTNVVDETVEAPMLKYAVEQEKFADVVAVTGFNLNQNHAAALLVRIVANADTDTDGDGVVDIDDAFPEDPNETTDTDEDGVGDNSDAFPTDATETVDSDGDGVGDNSDAFPNDASETVDIDGDGIGDNIDTDITDVLPPVFTDKNVTVTSNAHGILTDISGIVEGLIDGNKIGHTVSVTDAFDGPITPVLETENLLLPSGLHIITFSATDAAGNTATKEISYRIRPLVSLGTDVIAEAGSTLRIPVKLSGPAPEYPVIIDYLINTPTGSTTGQVTFEEDSLATELVLVIDSEAQAGDEIVIDSFADSFADKPYLMNAAIPEAMALTVKVSADNFAPTVDISVKQAEQNISTVSPTSGLVSITADISDINSSDEHSVSFEVVDSAFSGEVSGELLNSFTFDPANLATGTYQVKVTVTETNSVDLLSTEVFTSLYIDEALTEIVADSDQDGIPDSIDTDSDTSRLPVAVDEQPLQVQAGLKLVLGEHARGLDFASIAADALMADVEFDSVSSITNFNIKGLNVSGESVQVVLPLAQGLIIPKGAVYRKFTESKSWFNFVEDENNSLSSAVRHFSGNCPAPSSSKYTPGLTFGHGCIQLTIEDGGANDGDGLVNGEIADPGVLAVDHVNTLPEITLNNLSTFSTSQVTLSALTTDYEGDDVSYTWLQLSGPDVELSGASSSTISFTAPEVQHQTTLTFEVLASNGTDTSSQTVEVVVYQAPYNLYSSPQNDDSGGSFGWLLSLMGLAGLARRRFFKK
ncbi:DUF5011 domain-containing protein [Colwellia piezophila]|uniref:DUF5011 domain-containing protein n=1 Tax=Colwellia piezophila TaxID=211668 RepID=UPI00037685D2|nr:DUF5011 domain-containing protein [Colwellia piezophila]